MQFFGDYFMELPIRVDTSSVVVPGVYYQHPGSNTLIPPDSHPWCGFEEPRFEYHPNYSVPLPGEYESGEC